MRTAIEINSAFKNFNIIKYFKLLNSVNYLFSAIMASFLNDVRELQLKMLSKSGAPDALYDIEWLAKILYFEDPNDAL